MSFSAILLVTMDNMVTSAVSLSESLALAAMVSAPLTVSYRWPVPAAAVTVTADLIRFLVLPPDFQWMFPTATIIALYEVAVRTERRIAWTITIASTCGLTLCAFIARPGLDHLTENLSTIPWTALPAAIGDAVRSRRELLAAAMERAERAERTREEEALRRVTEERLRIARELHDVVAHHITLVNAQAGVAHHLGRSHPEHALGALERIRDTSRSALDELRATVSLLREPGEPPATAPTPGLTDLEDLLDSFRHTGLPVELHYEGDPEQLPAATGLTVYRIVQEALTNTRKHAGPAKADVRLEFAPRSVRLTIEDDGYGTAAGGDGTGYGLIGMRERARTVGGVVNAGRVPAPGTGFRVVAELPLPVHERGRP
jgi:signal transduction histidine kinase